MENDRIESTINNITNRCYEINAKVDKSAIILDIFQKRLEMQEELNRNITKQTKLILQELGDILVELEDIK